MSLADVLTQRPRQWLLRWPALANAATVGSLTSVAKLAAAVKIAVTARFFGAGDELDAFLTAFLLPFLFGEAVANALTPSVIPGLIHTATEQGLEVSHRLARAAVTWAVGFMLAMGLLLAATSPWVLPLLGSSFSSEKLRLTSVLFLGLLFWLPAGGLIAVWRGILNAHGRFALAALGPLASPAAAIVFLYTGAARWGIAVLVYATVAGLIAECALLAVAISRLGYPLLPAWSPQWTPELRRVLRQGVALVATALAVSANALIDQMFAGSLGSGAVSALGYGSKLVGVVGVVVASGVATAVLPEFSRLAARQEWSRLRHAALSYGGVTTAAILPVTFLLMWFSEPLARLFFERGAFSPADTRLVAQVQQFALLEAPVGVLFAVASRLATAVGANRALAQVALAALVVNVAADWYLARWLGVAGLALSTAVVRLTAVGLLLVLLHRREPRLFHASRNA